MSATAAPSRADAGLPRRLLLSGGLTFVLIGLLPALYGVALPVWSAAFGLAEGESGALLSAHGAGAFVAVAAGIAGLPFLTLRIGLGLLAAGAAILGLGAGWGGTLAGAFVAGIGYGTVSVVVNRRVLTECGDRGPGMLGVINAVFGLGAIAAPLLFLLAGSHPGPVFWGLALGAALVILAAAPAVPGATGPRGLPPLRDPRLLFLLFNMASIVVEVMLSSYGASALIDRGVSEEAAARLTSAFFATFLAGRLALWWLTRIASAPTLFLLGLVGSGLGALLAALGMPGTGYVLAGAFVGISFPSFYVWGTAVLGGDARMGSAVLTSGLLGATLGPLALRPILAATGDGGVFAAMAVLALGAAAAFALVLAKGPRAA